MNKKLFVVLEQGSAANTPLSKKHKEQFSTDYSDHFRLNWADNKEDKSADLYQKDITWSEGRNLLFERVKGLYEYYIFIDDDIDLNPKPETNLYGIFSVAKQLKYFFEEYKPLTGSINGDNWAWVKHNNLIKEDKKEVFGVMGHDLCCHFFQEDFANFMFPIRYHGSERSMWYAQFIAYKLFPEKCMVLNSIWAKNTLHDEHKDKGLSQYIRPRGIIELFADHLLTPDLQNEFLSWKNSEDIKQKNKKIYIDDQLSKTKIFFTQNDINKILKPTPVIQPHPRSISAQPPSLKKYIVTTTIQPPTKATLKFAAKKDWTLIVVGDSRTPHEEYESLNCIYLSPENQDKINKELSKTIGWGTIQRRNMGFIYAYLEGADVLAMVDDDNIPYDNWGDSLLIGKEAEIDLWESQNGYFDPLSVTKRNDLWHRGYPLEYVPTKNDIKYLGKAKRRVMVQADLWDGDPDIDAICRLTKDPCVKYDINAPYGSNQISPFNGQNTFLHRDIIPYYMDVPFVGRMCDIWGSYIVQKQFPNSIAYNKSSVYQDRNKQDLAVNLEEEIIGYKDTLNFIKGDCRLKEEALRAYDTYRKCFN